MTGRPPADEGVDAGDGESDGASGTGEPDAVDEVDAANAPVLERVPVATPAADESATGDAVECSVHLPDDLVGDLDDFCRQRYLHREAAIRSLLAEWLDGRSVE